MLLVGVEGLLRESVHGPAGAPERPGASLRALGRLLVPRPPSIRPVEPLALLRRVVVVVAAVIGVVVALFGSVGVLGVVGGEFGGGWVVLEGGLGGLLFGAAVGAAGEARVGVSEVGLDRGARFSGRAGVAGRKKRVSFVVVAVVLEFGELGLADVRVK